MGRRKIAREIINGIRNFIQKIGVERAILFGSYAKGTATRDSDIDLLLIGKKFRRKSFFERYRGLWVSWNLGYPVDFICLTPEECEKLKKRVSIVSEALRKGIEIE